ncbi:MAG: ABC transporter permease [Actinomycetota bacterium]
MTQQTDGGTLVEARDAPSQLPPARESTRALSLRRQAVGYYLLGSGAIWLFLFLVLPLVILIYTSLQTGGLFSGGFHFAWEFSNYSSGLSQYSKFFVRSIEYSIIVTAVALVLAYPMTYWIAFYGGKWKSSLLLLILMPFFVSFVIRTIQWKFLLADSGLILGPLKSIGLLPQSFHVLATPFAVVAGITYNFIPFTALPLYVALERIDKSLVEAAKDLYSSRWEAFRYVVWPLSIPGVFAAFLLTFVPATGDYVNVDVLGGPNTTMIGNIIQTRFLTYNDYPSAAALSVILMLGMLVLGSIYARVLGTEDATLAAATGA